MRRPTRAVCSLVAAVAVLGLVAPSPAGAATKKRVAAFAKHGPYAVGVTTLSLGDRDAEVWYPVAPSSVRDRRRDVYEIAKWLPQGLQDLLTSRNVEAPFRTNAYRNVRASRAGPFPLVLFSHGFSGWRDQSTFLTTHLASWGFVVASPDFLERGLAAQLGGPPATPRTEDDVINATLAAVRKQSAKPRGVLAKSARKGKVGIVGHSAGAGTAIRYASQPNVSTYVALAGALFSPNTGTTLTPPDKPSMYIAGVQDGIVGADRSRTSFDSAPPPSRFVLIDGAGHLNAMSDICEIGKGGGGVVALAQEAGIPVPPNLARLGTDGCFPPALASKQVWPVVRHFTTAQLRYEMGVDRRPVGLAPKVVKAFAPVEVTYSQTLGS
jgi:dienelactone hydrolase